MTLLCSTPMRSLFFGIVAFLILMLGTGSAAQDDTHGPIEGSVPVVSASPASSNRLASPDSCLPDGNEPNDNPSQATPWSSFLGQANFHTTSDVDWYRYTATGGQWHWGFLGSMRHNVPFELEVYIEATGQIVAIGEASRDPSIGDDMGGYRIDMIWYAPSSGNYLIKVAFPTEAFGLHACGSSNYSMNVGVRQNWQMAEASQLLGLVYHDDNWSGRWETEEPPIPAVTVVLRRAGGAIVATQETGSDGTFRFNDVAPGLYVVEETDPSGHVSSTSNRVVVYLFSDTVVYFGDYALQSSGRLQFLPLQLKQR